MAVFTLEDIQKAADKKYGSTDVELDAETTVHLRNPLRLDKDERKALNAALKNLGNNEDEDAEEDPDADVVEDQIVALRGIIRIVAAQGDKEAADLMLDVIGDDLATLMALFERFSNKEELGEASASAS